MNRGPQPSILVVSQYYYPEQFRINDMCSEWVKRGYKVMVVTGIPNYPAGRFFDGYGLFSKRKETYNGVKIVRIPLVSRGKSKIRLGLNYLSFLISGFLWQLFTKHRADIVFSFEVSPMSQVLPAVWYAKRRGVACMAYIQDLWPENFVEMSGISNASIVKIIDRMADYIYAHCSRIFVTSNSFKSAIERRGVPSSKVFFWPQYYEEFYCPSKDKSPLVEDSGGFSIAFTGNIGVSQGLDILPRAAKLLKDEGMLVRFILVGEGRGLAELVNEIVTYGVQDCFQFIPRQPSETIPSILASVDAAFLSFADKELFNMTIPAKLQSYMACGKPILAAVGGETKRVIEDADCGIVTELGNESALANAITRMSRATIEERMRWSLNAVNYAETHFNKKALMDAMDVHISECITQGSSTLFRTVD